MVLELHECCTTLTDYTKGLRSLGVETNTLTFRCFQANHDRLARAWIVLVVPRPDRDTPSPGVIAVLSRLEFTPVVAIVTVPQYARLHEWLSSGVHVLVERTAAVARLADQIRALMRITNEPPRASDDAAPLTRIERRILELISSQPGLPFSRGAILRHIYDDHRVVCPRTVDAHIKNLRRKLADPAAVRSVYGEGYSFDAGPNPI